jgi:peptide/nickel transport system substrate-binding protein
VVRQFRPRAYAAVVGAVALTMLAAACSSSSTSGSGSGSSSTGPQALAAGFQGLNPGTGAPQRGGTLNMVGISDVDYMDYDTGYYTTDFQVSRLTVRQLYSWPAIPNKNTIPTPDLATALPVISDNGLKQTVTLRSGVMWNTSPARAVTAADVVRGIKRACNPSPVFFGGMADFEATIKGLSAFCAGYPAAAGSNAAALKSYVEGHNVSGITTSGNTITFTLTKPAPWLVGAMTLSPFSAVPIEAENALPGTPGVYNHMYSDGPYQQVSYTPKKSIKFTRNPVWQASNDPLRKAYVNAINVDETGNQTTIYQQMSTGSPSLGMSFDALVPPADTPNLLNQIKSGSHNVNLGATYSSNPYLVFNTVSPNNGDALGKAEVRQALSYGIERSQLQKVLGGPIVNPALTHVLPTGIDGSQGVPAGYNPYAYDQAKAKSMLASAGYTASKPLQIKFLYRSDSQGSTAIFNNVSSQLNALGSVKVIGVPTNQSDFYGKYLIVPNTKSAPAPAYKGTWDMASAGWGPDWFGNSALSFFNPLYSSPGGFPASGGSNFGYFSSTAVNNLISQALSQPTEPEADKFWAQADQQVMKEAAVYPITSPLQLAEHAPYVHNAVYMTQWQNFDPANVWLSTPGSS